MKIENIASGATEDITPQQWEEFKKKPQPTDPDRMMSELFRVVSGGARPSEAKNVPPELRRVGGTNKDNQDPNN